MNNTSHNIEQIGKATKTHGFISNKNLTNLLWKFHRKNKVISRSMSVADYQAKAKSIVDENLFQLDHFLKLHLNYFYLGL